MSEISGSKTALSGNLLAGQSVALSVHELKELRDYKSALDQTSIVAITDSRGVITYANDQFCQISGYSREELVGKTHKVVNSGHHSKDFFEEMWAAISAGRTWAGEVKNETKDGGAYWVDTTIVPFIEAGQSKPYQYLAIRTDITKRKELELEVIRQDRLASVGILASGLAHEVGTPLGVIRGRAEMLSEELRGVEGYSKSLDAMIQQIDRITVLIDSLLRISRKDNKGGEKFSMVELAEAIESVLVLIRQSFKSHGVSLLVNIPRDLVIQGQPNQVQQIILNLLINSLQAISKVRQDERSDDREMKVSLFAGRADDRVVLSVRDTGCGIRPESMKKIFEPFFTTKDVGEGTGLGLSIASQLLGEMGASISVDSTVGKGSEFKLMFRTGEDL